MGRFHALPPTFLGNILDIPFQQAKAVADNCSDVAASPLPIPLCALCVLCGSPPHPESLAKRRGVVFELAWGGGAMLSSLPFGRNNSICRFQPTKPVSGIISPSQANLPLPSSAPLRLCASSPDPEPQCLQLCPNGLFEQPLDRGYPKRRRLQAMVADQSAHCRNRNRNRDRDR